MSRIRTSPRITARQMALAKAIYNQLYYLANAERWATTYADNKRRLRRAAGKIERQRWTAEESRILRRLYPRNDTAWVAGQMNRSVASLYQQADKLGLKKDPAYQATLLKTLGARLHESGKPHRFPKGHVPANKGLRRPGWGPGRMKETQFKKGARSGTALHNYRPLGSTRLVDGYLYIKVAEVPNVPYTVNWLPVHILEWERANGRPLPEGHCLRFLDDNRMNTSPANLELLTRAENMRRNSVHNLPKELALAVQLRGALIRQINKRSKREKPDHRSA